MGNCVLFGMVRLMQWGLATSCAVFQEPDMLVLKLHKERDRFLLKDGETVLLEGISRQQLLKLLPRLKSKGFVVDNVAMLFGKL